MTEGETVAYLAHQYFVDLTRENQSDNDKNLRAWLWFTCPARLREQVSPAILKLRKENKHNG